MAPIVSFYVGISAFTIIWPIKLLSNVSNVFNVQEKKVTPWPGCAELHSTQQSNMNVFINFENILCDKIKKESLWKCY